MKFARILYSLKALAHELWSTKALESLLGVFGVLWLLVELSTYFFPETILFGKEKLPEAIRHGWLFFLTGGVIIAIWRCRPQLSIIHKLNSRDVSIEIAIADIFSLHGAMIVGSNTTFDTRTPAVISSTSVQGQFTQKYYNGEAQLDAEISSGLKGVASQQLTGKRLGNSKRYPVGTCVRVSTKERKGYLLAIAHINEHGTASSTFEELKGSLASLWEYIGTRGSKEPLLIPVLGTGFTRLRESREEIVREIIKSFVAACSERTFSEKLTIVIPPADISNHKISFEGLGKFLQFQCEYTTFADNNNKTAIGTAT